MPRRRRAAEAGWLAPRTIVLFLGSLLAFSAVAWGRSEEHTSELQSH